MAEGLRLRGVKELRASLNKIEATGDAATAAAVQAIAAAGVTRVRSRLRGRPRWNHRGRSTRTGEEVNLEGPTHLGRSGGPGKFTGSLYRGVGKVKKPKRTALGYEGGFGIGGGVRNLYKAKLERTYPFFGPALDGLEPKAAALWDKAWTRVVNRRGW